MPMTAKKTKQLRVLAVASGGGHWVQLLRLRPAFEDCYVTYVTVRRAYASDVPGCRMRVINDATRWNKVRLAFMGLRLAWIVLLERPDVIVSTGAAPGYFAIRLGKMLGARTIWLDSIANVEHVSMTGQIVGRHTDLWLTQWSHLATDGGPRCEGAVV
jgi:exopolysaccharide biosynthesis glucuronosyltransferase PssD